MVDFSRRRFMVLSALSTAAASLWTACARFQPSTALTPEEKRIVEALADQVIPPDEPIAASASSRPPEVNRKIGAAEAASTGRAGVFTPGGRDAGVAEFIDRQLRGPYRRYRAAYKTGLAKIDATSRRAEGVPFAELPFARQTAVLEAIEADRMPGGIWGTGEAPAFFRLVADHCLQGFYGSPRHGGNRDYASWKMLGLDQPQILGRVTGR